MYGKINESGKFEFAPIVKRITKEDGTIVTERYTKEEITSLGYKEVLMGDGEGYPDKGKKPNHTFEDKGEFIIRRTNWVAK